MLTEILAQTSELDHERILRISATASKRYKVYHVAKKSGGTREISHPSQELKAIQRWIVRAVFDRFPIHQSATAYRKGSSIRENAELHRRTSFTNRYDFSSFFPSFRDSLIREFLRSKGPSFDLNLSREDEDFVCQVVCKSGRLTIGAPSSPTITNVMMYDFDRAMHKYAIEQDLVYSRYADDLFVSAYDPNCLRGVEEYIREAKRNIGHLSLRLNRRKTALLSRKYRRRVAGVVITPDQKLSIGRERKREIKALIHRWVSGQLPPEDFHHMLGLVAFARDIEPSFEDRLKRKYGDRVIENILAGPEKVIRD